MNDEYVLRVSDDALKSALLKNPESIASIMWIRIMPHGAIELSVRASEAPKPARVEVAVLKNGVPA